MKKKKHELILNKKDLEILEDVLWEIEGSRVYEDEDDKKSLDKLKDFFDFRNIKNFNKGIIELEDSINEK